MPPAPSYEQPQALAMLETLAESQAIYPNFISKSA